MDVKDNSTKGEKIESIYGKVVHQGVGVFGKQETDTRKYKCWPEGNLALGGLFLGRRSAGRSSVATGGGVATNKSAGAGGIRKRGKKRERGLRS